LLCNMTVTLLWKCNELIVTQQELLRYYSNAANDLTCHNIDTEALGFHSQEFFANVLSIR
jgi:hypothetical protein